MFTLQFGNPTEEQVTKRLITMALDERLSLAYGKCHSVEREKGDIKELPIVAEYITEKGTLMEVVQGPEFPTHYVVVTTRNDKARQKDETYQLQLAVSRYCIELAMRVYSPPGRYSKEGFYTLWSNATSVSKYWITCDQTDKANEVRDHLYQETLSMMFDLFAVEAEQSTIDKRVIVCLDAERKNKVIAMIDKKGYRQVKI